MLRASDTVRGFHAGEIVEFNVLELFTGTIPATGDSPKTGTRLVLWPGTLRWTQGIYPDWRPVRYLADDYDSMVAENTGTVGYARLRAVPNRRDVSGATLPPLLVDINADLSDKVMYLTVGLPGSGADLIMSQLDIAAGLPLSTLSSGSFTVRGG